VSRRIISITPFFNETHVLELRLGVLNDTVDHFFTIEADKTFTYLDKPMLANTVKSPKHTVVEIEMPHYSNPWQCDYYQRDYKIDLSYYNDDDIVLVTDLDEIPRPESLEMLREAFDPEYSYVFMMLTHQYYLNNQNVTEGYIDRAKAYSVKQYMDPSFQPSLFRFVQTPSIVIPEAGWHWTYLGDTDFIRNKIESFAHSEFNNDSVKDRLQYNLENNVDTLGRPFQLVTVDIDSDFYPKHIRENRDRYKKYIKEL